MESNTIQGAYHASANAAVAKAYTAPAAATASAGGVDPAQFMQLIMAQLTHQNPMEPMNDSEMMGQMAQLNSLQELQKIRMAMTEMAFANQTSYAASLIGKNVRSGDASGWVEGKVTGVTIESGRMIIHVGEKSFPLDDLREIEGEKTDE